MAFIHWEFLVNFDQFALVVVNLLVEAQGGFRVVHFLEVAGTPAESAGYVQSVTPSAAGELVPGTELLLVLRACAHRGLARVRVGEAGLEGKAEMLPAFAWLLRAGRRKNLLVRGGQFFQVREGLVCHPRCAIEP